MSTSFLIVVWLAAAGGQERQLVRPLSVASQPVPLADAAAPTKGWTMRAQPDAPEAGLERLRAEGGTVRIAAGGPSLLYRPAFALSGDGSVSVTFLPANSKTATYGLTLGGEQGIAFLLRDDGAVGTASCENGVLGAVTWLTAAAPEIGDGVRHLEVRTRDRVADVVVNGGVRATVSIDRGVLDGVPGVYTDGHDDLGVAGFRVSRQGVNPYASATR